MLAVLPWTLQDIAIGVVVIAAVVALVYIALRAFNITLPEWFKQTILVVIVAVVIIVAIRFVFSL